MAQGHSIMNHRGLPTANGRQMSTLKTQRATKKEAGHILSYSVDLVQDFSLIDSFNSFQSYLEFTSIFNDIIFEIYLRHTCDIICTVSHVRMVEVT